MKGIFQYEYTLCEHHILISTHCRAIALALFRFVALVKHFDGESANCGFMLFDKMLIPQCNNFTYRFFQHACPELVETFVAVAINNAVPGHMLNPTAIQFDWTVCYWTYFVCHCAIFKK